ncbi:Transposase and inactivated derivatives [Collinsella aerofaciens]|nr:Transposase and inactivated derivatives [Collinsella aerofaciens]
MNERHDDLQEIIDAALREMAAEEGDGFDPQACNLAEFCRRTGLTRSRARTVRAHGFRALPHGNSGRRAAPGVLAGHTGLVDDLLRKGVTNSQVIFERLLGQGYAGGLTTVKTYIAAHRDLVPAKRRQAAPQGCRGQRFRTAPGEAYQMDWGFVAVERPGGERARIACFAMVCHHCGGAHVEFFPNARQENLLIGMLHAFSALGRARDRAHRQHEERGRPPRCRRPARLAGRLRRVHGRRRLPAPGCAGRATPIRRARWRGSSAS